MDRVIARAPATVSNVVCGFDCLGFALEKPFDEITVIKTDEPGIRIRNVGSHDIPTDPERNVAGVALQAMIAAAEIDHGFEIEIKKGIKPGSGVGSSAASSCGTIAGANALIENKFSTAEMLEFAMTGEMLASGSRHADNIAPCFHGGFTLVRSTEPLDIVPLKFPQNLYATVIHPQIEIKTSEARALLPENVPLKRAVENWSNLGAFVAALAVGDLELLSRSMQDAIVEPVRKTLIPSYNAVKTAGLEAGAIGGGISGSGPSIFFLSDGPRNAESVERAIRDVYAKTGLDFETYLSPVSLSGTQTIF